MKGESKDDKLIDWNKHWDNKTLQQLTEKGIKQKEDNNTLSRITEPQHQDIEIIKLHYKHKRMEYHTWAIIRLLVTVLVSSSLLIGTYLLFSDTRHQILAEEAIIKSEQEVCRQHFELNKCYDPLPALAAYCQEMNQCLSTVPRTRIRILQETLSVMANSINTLISKLELKSIITIFAIVLLFTSRKKLTTIKP